MSRFPPVPDVALPHPVVDNHCHLDIGRDGESLPDPGRQLAVPERAEAGGEVVDRRPHLFR